MLTESSTVPLLDLAAQHLPLREEILAAITRVVDSQRFIMGPDVTALENELAEMLQVGHAVAVSSGTDALLLALMAIDLKPGDEVITTVYSFFATAGAICRLGARPVFVDIDPVTFNLDTDACLAAINNRTKAILPVHLFGLSANLEPIMEAASRLNIAVIEDSAQAIGATYKSRLVGSVGAFGCFSFFPSKNVGAFGDAGLLTTNDEQLAKSARLLRTHGMQPKYYHHVIGGNFRMDTIQAAVLRVKLPHLPAWTMARRANAARYRSLFQEAERRGDLTLPVESKDCQHVFNQFVIRTPDRDGLKRHLDRKGIGSEIYYPVPFHLQPCFAHLGYLAGSFPNAEGAAQTSLAIPIYPELTPAQQETVAEEVLNYVSPDPRARQ